MKLPSDPKTRKKIPLARGFLDYFPRACAAIAEVSRVGNEQHNPGQPLHWNRELSSDHADCIVRHLIDRGTVDSDGLRHTAKLAWRALALLETELELEGAAPDNPPANYVIWYPETQVFLKENLWTSPWYSKAAKFRTEREAAEYQQKFGSSRGLSFYVLDTTRACAIRSRANQYWLAANEGWLRDPRSSKIFPSEVEVERYLSESRLRDRYSIEILPWPVLLQEEE